jgi:TrkA domain protein
MTRVEETRLPGVGIRYEFETESGYRIGVIHHRTGRLEIFVSGQEDPDLCLLSVSLNESEARVFAEVLGGMDTILTRLSDLQQEIEGLALDWLEVSPDSVYAGKTIGDARIRTRTGVSVVAVLRDGQAVPAPGPEQHIAADDTLVVVGTPEGIEKVAEILRAG